MSAALRLFAPTSDGSEGGSPPRQTLDALFQSHTLPRLEEENRSMATIREYRTHLRRWAEFWQAGGPKHADQISACSLHPPEGKGVTLDELLAFRRWVGRKLGCSPRTKNKHVQTIQAVLADAHKYRQVPGLLALESLPETTAAPKYYFRDDQLAALYQASAVAAWPSQDRCGVDQSWTAGEAWRCALAMYATYGFRTQELIQFEPDHQPLTWGQISWEAETPNPEGQATCQYGWFSYVPQKQRGAKPQSLHLPLTEIVAAHLKAILPRQRPASGTPIFNFPRCNRNFYGTWEAIVAAARLKPKGPAEAEYLPKHLRKTCSTMLNKHRRGLAPLVMGHASRAVAGNVVLGGGSHESAVNEIHYDNAEEAIVEGLLSLPLPDAFRQVFDRRQLTLF